MQQAPNINLSLASPNLEPRNASAELIHLEMAMPLTRNRHNTLTKVKNFLYKKLHSSSSQVEPIENDQSMHNITLAHQNIITRLSKNIKSSLTFTLYGVTFYSITSFIVYLIYYLQGYITNNTIVINFYYFMFLNIGIVAGVSITLHVIYKTLKYFLDKLTKPLPITQLLKQSNTYEVTSEQIQKKELLIRNYRQQKMALCSYVFNETYTPLQVTLDNLKALSTQLKEQTETLELIKHTIESLKKIELIIYNLQKLYTLLEENTALEENFFTSENLINYVFQYLAPYTTPKNLVLIYDSNFSKKFELLGDFNKIAKILINLLINIINRTTNDHIIELVINKELERLSYVQLYFYIKTRKKTHGVGYNSGSTSESTEETATTESPGYKIQKFFALKHLSFDTTIASKLINELNEKNLFQKIDNIMGIKCYKKKPIFWFRLPVQKITKPSINQQEYFNANQNALSQRQSNLSKTELFLPQYNQSSQSDSLRNQCTASSSSEPAINPLNIDLPKKSRINFKVQ